MNLYRRALSLFVLGALIGPIGDACHVLSGTLAYPEGAYAFYFFKMPFWTPLLFGAGTCLLGLLQLSLDRKFSRGRARPRHLAMALGGFLLLHCVSGFLPKTGWSANLCLYGLAVAQWAAIERTRTGILTGVVAAYLGTAFEAILVQQGVFSYLPGNTELMGVPSWLPALYFAAAIAVAHFNRSLSAGPAVLASTEFSYRKSA